MPSGWEWAILVVIALLLIGGSRLPGITRNPPSAPGEPVQESAAVAFPATTEDRERDGHPMGAVATTPATPTEPERG